MNFHWIAASLAPVAVVTFAIASGCGTTSAPNPFFTDGGVDAAGHGGGGGAGGAGAGGGAGGGGILVWSQARPRSA